MEGTQWSKLEAAPQCVSDLSALMDDFFFLHKNHTDLALDQAGMELRVLNVTGILAGPY